MPAPPATTVPAPVPPVVPAPVPPVVPATEEPVPSLTTYAGTAVDASFEFDHPSAWTVADVSTRPIGFFEVKGADGEPIATLQMLVAWGAVCDAGCKYHPVTHLGEVAGSTLSTGLPFSVRSTAMDLSHDPEERRIHQWTDNVRVQTSLSAGEMLPADPEMLPRLLYSLGNVDTGVTASNGVTTRTVIFTASRDVASMQAAIDYTESEEYLQIQAMMASFRG
ncbi:hypothetical protein [Arthrobacter sp. H41]|uniref:hypothetical protein n=1 Tax=Arthrobacter sp. H41 TaxID=1312978 RepID=UPI001C1E1A79|nr:hypothetical protein [Arthrobacter sp. H41]